MEGEFKKEDYPQNQKIKMTGRLNDLNDMEYDLKLEFPYGTINIDVFISPLNQAIDELELKNIPEEEKDFKKIMTEPEPVSMEQLRIEHA